VTGSVFTPVRRGPNASTCRSDRPDRSQTPVAAESERLSRAGLMVRVVSETVRIWTIGHSNHPIDRFIALLREASIQVVADVRSQPYSAYAGHFSQAPLRTSLEEAGLRYVFLGRELGGRPPEAGMYDEDGHVLYDVVAASDRFEAGLDRLLEGARSFRVALMCSEEDPTECHRTLLIGEAIRRAGLPVSLRHVRATAQPEQMTIIDPGDVAPWRSARSVSPSTPLQASSTS